MKTKFYFFIIATLLSAHLFAQVKAIRPLAQKTVATSPATMKTTSPKSVKTETAPPKSTDLQKAVINVVSGDDGKDYNTLIDININDGNQRKAAYCGNFGKEYFPGENQTMPSTLIATEYTGEIDSSKYPPVPVLREATLLDFASGGSIDIEIATIGNDTWKISSFSLTLFFNNDPSSPHKITWPGFTLTQDNKTKHLEFDKNFNAIQ